MDMDETNPNLQALREQVIQQLRECYDPEIPVNIYDMGLVYDIDIQDNGSVSIQMTLTSPMCPVAGSLPIEVQERVKSIPGVSSVQVDLVWEPPWSPDMLSEAAKLELGIE
ncbi:MAG TPA: SUF system Fe-S cluster assembly protein [bacterium]|nr:SUF system Fe-S cluster assembly protein [Candidatus Omnitrophota bacterium]HOJ61568.1 SUF system Fe-S cluster assembly protein [bacterium]HOL94030.1 SUF system Fe-S cluster assembly protein [bacterium]HPP00003.1 SUF system Fe-S cluster assembly protein [bacterium]HXK93183.1 SUF system Fe-S cluster assembly protein [bacterium]